MVTPYYADDWLTVYQGDCRTVLASMPDESVHCVVTSPPYWGLRDYGITPSIWPKPDEWCMEDAHEWGEPIVDNATNHTDKRRWQHTRNGRDEEQPPEKRVAWRRTDVVQGAICRKCGAWAGSLGLEPTPELYVQHIVDVFRDVRRKLRKDGTLWLNLGDSYTPQSTHRAAPGTRGGMNQRARDLRDLVPQAAYGKPKDLVGIPWRVAFALQADGWYLRSDIIWAKPNPMPESVTDRPTKSHEYLFLLSKAARYYYDAEAVREADSGSDHARAVLTGPSLEPSGGLAGPHTGIRAIAGRNGSGRNLRSVWTVATQPYPGAHFATFPAKLVEPCIKAGCPENGVVLDPFAGSGTTGMVAQSLSRKAVLIDLNADYLVQAMGRNAARPLGL